MKGEKMAKRSSFGSIVRKKFADITNLQPQPKFAIQDENPPPASPSTKEYIDKLIKAKMKLTRLIEDRNKIIELSEVELRKLRINYQKMQLQNWNLAQSNSQILAELNSGREKLKSLQHDLVCKDALLKAKNLELQGKENMNSQKTHSQDGEEAVDESLRKANDDKKPPNANRRRHSTRSQSMGPSTSFQQAAEKEMDENKRRRLRRQSARFKSQQREPIENLFEIQDAKFPVSQPLDNPMHEDGPTVLGSSVGEEEEQRSASRFEARESQRSSIGRPLRRAAEKVQSYKEIPLNIKMRRSE
ncbi:hypothetical protein L1049_013251 [Liquidambar formosana]|uniref:Shugoshin C-terminal domain-containing protein n=1 Tax=Liquidambar formosana TaxID=63359 RepID=A0AAP0RN89_LIQFO